MNRGMELSENGKIEGGEFWMEEFIRKIIKWERGE